MTTATGNLESARALLAEMDAEFDRFLAEEGKTEEDLLGTDYEVSENEVKEDTIQLARLTAVHSGLLADLEMFPLFLITGRKTEQDAADLDLALELSSYKMLTFGRAHAATMGEDDFVKAYDEALAHITEKNPELPQLVSA